MPIDFFDYELPPHLIAQKPCAERDQSRLLVVDRRKQALTHHIFRELPELLVPGDLLVLNDTRVLPARLLGRRARTGGKWEGLFLRVIPDGCWELLCQTRGRLIEGEAILIDPGPFQLILTAKSPAGHWLARPSELGEPARLLERYGQIPLPPYIRKGRAVPADQERYQTIYARHGGAVAAPTAGLHFTPDVFECLKQRGIRTTALTLHVGLGTFAPIKTEDFTQHIMHREWGELSQEAAAEINACRQHGGRIVAVGTTVVRVLETVAGSGAIRPWSGETDLFIYPPYPFRVVDALVTNFHLPRTSLLLLVGALAGIDFLHQAYRTAIEHQYRFYSYGDAMLIL